MFSPRLNKHVCWDVGGGEVVARSQKKTREKDSLRRSWPTHTRSELEHEKQNLFMCL